MKSKAHWTPGYVLARSRELVDQKLNPDNPWLTRQAVDLLAELLKPDDQALEFGGGRSTPWIAKRVGHLTSVDDNAEWHARVRSKVDELRITNVTLALCPKDVAEEDGAKAAYVRVVDRFSDGALGFCLVDGMYRDHCAMEVIPKLSAGAVLAIDNASWLLPSKSTSPNSIPPGGKPYSPTWQRFLDETIRWRHIWTYSGVTATLLMFKP